MKTKLLLKFLLLAIAAILLSVKNLYAESEPNNTPAQANTLALNGTGAGTNSPIGDVDWWKFTTNTDGRVYITISNDGTHDLKQVVLYDADGVTELNNAYVGNGVGGLVQDGLAAGTYYLKIFNNDVNPEISDYTIKDSLATLSQANDKEPNNNFMHADKINLNSSITGHIGYYYNYHRDTSDWYKLTTNGDGMIKLTLDRAGNTSSALVHLSLFDNNGTTLLKNADIGNGVGGLVQDGLAAGTYYIQVAGEEQTGNAFGGYTLLDSLIKPAQANDQEPDNNRSEAKTLAVNHSTTGHIGYYYNYNRDTSDWYKLTTSADGMLQITFDGSSNTSGNLVYVSLFDNDGTTLLANASVGTGLGGLSKDGLAAGTYYIQLRAEESIGNAYTGYTLKDSLKTYKYAADAEPNAKPYQADSLPLNSTITGHVNFYYNNKKDTADWYLLHYTDTSAKLSLTVKIAPSLIDNSIHGIHLDFYKDTLNAPVITKAFFASVNKFKIAHGKYYVKIYADDESSGYSAYSISNTTPPVNAVSDIVLNSSPVINSKFTWNIFGNANQNNCSVQLQLNNNASISVKVVSLSGNLVQNINTENMQKGNYNIPINLNNALPGIYVVNLIVDDKLYSKKIMK